MAPQVVSKTCWATFSKDMPQRPYLTFQLRAGELHSLVIRTWSHDQGWCNPEFRVEDPYANSSTWFSLGVVDEATSLPEAESELREFQRNVRASKGMRCHTNHWAVGRRDEEPESDAGVRGLLESLEPARELTVGVFPLARYLGWVNWVWKVEVELHFKADVDRGPPAADLNSSSGSVRIVPSEEAMDIFKSAIPPSSEHPRKKAAALRDILDRQREQYRRTRDLSDLDDAIAIAQIAADVTPADAPSRPRFLMDLESLTAEKDSRAVDL